MHLAKDITLKSINYIYPIGQILFLVDIYIKLMRIFTIIYIGRHV